MMTETFTAALQIMAIGMAGVFLFMLLFWIIITGLHRIFPGKTEENGTEATP